jgi:hypothetical protein
MNTAFTSWNPLTRWPWLWFVAAFALLLAAWTIFFIIAAKHPTPDVKEDKIPLIHQSH